LQQELDAERKHKSQVNYLFQQQVAEIEFERSALKKIQEATKQMEKSKKERQ